ncbi:hypothetical protein POM88_051254 [Heracleum sosnowskyi]|uniref:Uncharacterized protein n=1 Tax=Heracleum sosnowskyi TaxID=360622 RepID=A0AAD8H093_9APIA|nr:hypothetical protein POM88_051254 [Heracleum sosnowskyi]
MKENMDPSKFVKFAQIVGSGVKLIIRKHLYVRADSNYLVMSKGGFKSVVLGLIAALRDVNSKWSSKERSHYEECIGFRADAVLLSENWGEISANYLSGEPLWQSFVIADEISVVKYLPPPMEVCLWNDSTKETAFKESIRQYSRAVRKAAMEAWEEAKGGFDEEDFFEEKGYGKVEEAAARMALKASVEANL